VQYTVTVSGANYTATATFNVVAPTYSVSTSTTQVNVGPYSVNYLGQNALYFNSNNGNPGIEFSQFSQALVQMPSGYSGTTE